MHYWVAVVKLYKKAFSEPPLNAALPFALIQLFLICFWLYISTNPNLVIFAAVVLLDAPGDFNYFI